MSKELLWSEEQDFVYGWKTDFESKEEFIEWVKNQYEDGECDVTNVKIESCLCTEEGIPGDVIIPLSHTDVCIENFYTAEVRQIREDDIF